MASSRLNMSILVSLFLSASNFSFASPIASLNEDFTRIYMTAPRYDNSGYPNDQLIFESDWNGGGGRQTRDSLVSDYSQRPVGTMEGVPSEIESGRTQSEHVRDRIDFQPTRPPSRHKYNRRPSSTKASNGVSFLQNSSELWRTLDADEKSEFSSILNKDVTSQPYIESRITFPTSTSESINTPTEDASRSDIDIHSSGQDETEEDLLNMFFAHVRTTAVPQHHLYAPENIEIKKYKGKHSSFNKPGKYSYPLDKHGKKKKTKNPEDNIRNVVLQADDSDDEDSDELAFLTFDSGIQRRKCASGSVKDGKCRPPSTVQ